MGGESGRMFPFTLQTPTRHPCLYFSLSNTRKHTHRRTDECTYAHLPCLCGSQQLLCRGCESGADMRGSVGKLVFRRKRTGQVRSAPRCAPFKAERDKLHTRRSAAQSHHLSFHSVRRECGSKWDDARPSPARREITRRTATVEHYSVWYVDQRSLYCSLCIKCCERNCWCFITLSTCWLDVARTTMKTTACWNVSDNQTRPLLIPCFWHVMKSMKHVVDSVQFKVFACIHTFQG